MRNATRILIFVGVALVVSLLALTNPVVAQQATRITNAVTASASSYLTVRLTDGSSFLTADTQFTHDGAVTRSSTTGGAMLCTADADGDNTDVAGNDAVLVNCDLDGSVWSKILSIAAGNNNIGDVDVASIAAGNNNIGDVDVASIAAGNNNIGDVDAVQSGTWTVQPGNTANTTAWLVKDVDPCSSVAKTYIPINISTATTTELTASLAGASTHYYVCSINIGPVAGAQNIALVDDDSDNCASVTSGVAGGTTAGSGWNIAANGGLTFGNGSSSIARTNGTNRVLCAVTSAAVQTSGVMTVVAAP